jgi:hypothetical protein
MYIIILVKKLGRFGTETGQRLRSGSVLSLELFCMFSLFKELHGPTISDVAE